MGFWSDILGFAVDGDVDSEDDFEENPERDAEKERQKAADWDQMVSDGLYGPEDDQGW